MHLCVCVCVVQYMCLSCSIDLASICANKEIYNNNENYNNLNNDMDYHMDYLSISVNT